MTCHFADTHNTRLKSQHYKPHYSPTYCGKIISPSKYISASTKKTHQQSNRVATHFFKKFFQVFKIRIFWSIFSSLRLKTVLDSIKTLKRYCKATLICFLIKIIFDDDKKKSIGTIFCFKAKFYY